LWAVLHAAYYKYFVAPKSAVIISYLTLGFLLLLALAAKPIWSGREQWHFGQGADDGVYLVTAKAIATGQGYRIPSLPGVPFAVKYPPIFPAFLSIAWRIRPDFPGSARVGAVMQALLVPLFLALLLAVLRRWGCSWRRAFLVAALTLVSMQVALLTIMLFSEILCTCLLFASVLAAERAAESDVESAVDNRHAVPWVLASGLLGGVAYLTRNATLPLLAAAPVYFFLKKKPRLAVYFLLASLPLAAWWHVWAFTHIPTGPDATNGSYFTEYIRNIRMHGFWANVLKQLNELSGGVAEAILPGVIAFTVALPLYHIGLAAAISGGIRCGRRTGWPLYLIFSGFLCVMMIFWWGPGMMRLTVSAWPALLAGIAEEMAYVAGMFESNMQHSPFWSRKSPAWRAVPRWTLIALGIMIVFRNENRLWHWAEQDLAGEHRLRLQDLPAFAWIAGHSNSDTVVLAWKDTTTYLYTGAAASRSLFIAATPQSPETKTYATSFSALPKNYSRGLLLILQSDLELGSSDRDLVPLQAAAAGLAGAQLEFTSPGAFIYSFPIPR